MTTVADDSTWEAFTLPIVRWPRHSIGSVKTITRYLITINRAYWSLQKQGQFSFRVRGPYTVIENSNRQVDKLTEPERRIIDSNSLLLPSPT